MESGGTWEYTSLITELTQGMDKAKQLRFHLCLTSPTEPESLLLLQRVLSSFEKALLILKWKGVSAGQLGQPQLAAAAPLMSSALESSISVDGSPRSDELNRRDHQDNITPKKRKLQPTWTEQVKVSSDSGLEGPADDGYSWRKYGQKDILGAKYPRSYYRCTYRAVQNCWATKQVQRSDDDPMIFEVTYRGSHTCNHLPNGVPLPASPEKQELKHNHQTLTNFKANLRVSTENLDSIETPPAVFSFPSTYPSSHIDGQYYFPVDNLVEDNHLGGYSPLFLLSPDTSESNYFSPAACQIRNFAGTHNYQHSESDIGEIISANASTTNSPIGGIDFLMDTAEQDPNFPFNTTGFFP